MFELIQTVRWYWTVNHLESASLVPSTVIHSILHRAKKKRLFFLASRIVSIICYCGWIGSTAVAGLRVFSVFSLSGNDSLVDRNTTLENHYLSTYMSSVQGPSGFAMDAFWIDWNLRI